MQPVDSHWAVRPPLRRPWRCQMRNLTLELPVHAHFAAAAFARLNMAYRLVRARVRLRFGPPDWIRERRNEGIDLVVVKVSLKRLRQNQLLLINTILLAQTLLEPAVVPTMNFATPLVPDGQGASVGEWRSPHLLL